MKKLFIVCGTVAMLLLFTGLVNADLLGEHVLVERHFPTLDQEGFTTVYNNNSFGVEVANGDGDKVTFGSQFTVDVGATNIVVDFLKFVSFAEADFNGLVIRRDPSPEYAATNTWGSDYILLGVTVDTDLADVDWDPLDDIIFGEDFVAFNWSKVEFQSDTYFEAMLEFGPNPIPIPATMVLFITGLFGFATFQRLTRKKLKQRSPKTAEQTRTTAEL